MTHPFTPQDITLAKETWELGYKWEWNYADWALVEILTGLGEIPRKEEVMYVAWLKDGKLIEFNHPSGHAYGSGFPHIPIPLPHQVEVVLRRLEWRFDDDQEGIMICQTPAMKDHIFESRVEATDRWMEKNRFEIMHPNMVTRYLLALVEGLKRRGK